MNFINDIELAKRFSAGEVSSAERLRYFLLFMLLCYYLMSSYAGQYLPCYINQVYYFDYIVDVIEITFFLVGTLLAYKVNVSGDNKEFIERYICIGFPIAIQMALIGIFIYGVMSIYESSSDTATNITDVIIIIVLNIYYYVRFYRAIKVASHS